jgi:hypothetical protein
VPPYAGKKPDMSQEEAASSGCAPTQAVEMRPGCKVEGVTDPVDLVVLAR